MPSLSESLPAILEALREDYGTVPAFSPAEDPFARVLRAFLSRAASPSRATAILTELGDGGLLDPEALLEIDAAELAAVLEGAGVTSPRKLVGPLSRLADWATSRRPPDDSIATETLRDELRSLRGIGPATADAVLLHALGRPAYPVDRGTYRVLVRHGWIDPTAEYDEAREVVEHAAGPDPSTLGTLAWGLGHVAEEFCRVAAARCERCPLRPFLPGAGPLLVGTEF